ncbi:TPA: BppU family phage baseplate upper protein [Bacillus mobilis]|nr:BppU family phage baseplate upper protein [Bacillus mobilis]
MTFKTYEINVDLVDDVSVKAARFSQGDKNSAKFILNLKNEGRELDLSQAKSVRMSFKKPDGTRVFQNDCQPINAMKGKYQIVLKTQTLTSVGDVIAQIHIEEEDRILDTQKFFFVVNESLSGDGAIESTNEFSIIKSAIEAGKKLEGKDIDGIIAAGVKADGAVKKTGDTMTGSLKFNRDKGIAWNDGTKDIHSITTGGDNKTYFTDGVNGVDYAIYDPATKSFNLLRNTNLLKKSGDFIAGDLVTASNFTIDTPAQAERFLQLKSPRLNTTFGVSDQGDTPALNLFDHTNMRFIMQYTKDKGLVVDAPTNLLKKSGDTMSGQATFTGNDPMSFRPAGDNPWWLVNTSQNTLKFVPSKTNGQADWEWGKAVWITKDGTIRQGKDGRADLVLTADGENFNGNIGPIADRYGNTVTLRAGLRRKSGATGTLMTTLPLDMRPTMSIINTIPSTDGTPARVTVQPNGEVHLENAGSVSISGKDIYMAITYVVK